MSCEHDCPKPPLFPRPIFNRPGLNRIDYRIGTYADVRAYLFDRLNQQPELVNWTHRGADDPGIALLEGSAVVADILTFYQSLYANEAYLRTAQWSESIADLVRLGGYRLAPGVAGEATFALAVKGAVKVTVPMGFGLKAQLVSEEKPVEFETRAALEAHPNFSAFNLYRPRMTPAIHAGDISLRVAASDVALKADDRLLLGAPVSGDASRLLESEIVTVAKVWEAFGARYVQLKTALTRSTPVMQLVAYKLGETLHHFGHNAPNTITTVDSNGVASTSATSYQRLLNTTTTTAVDPDLAPKEMPLDREFAGIAAGATVLIQGRFSNTATSTRHRYTLVRNVVEVENRSYTWGMLAGASTVLTLDKDLVVTDGGHAHPYTDMRSLTFMQVTAAPLTLHAPDRATSAVTGNSLRYFGNRSDAQALEGRRLLFVHSDAGVDEVTVQSVTPAAIDATFHALTVSAPVTYADFAYDAPTVTVYGNIVDASQGKTIASSPIGSGDARALFQTFALPKAPLTYLFDAARTPAQTPALEIYVDHIRWTRVETFFNTVPDAQIYIVREDVAGSSFVQFGDGKTGARLPSGRDNVVATYRTGIGAHGALKPDTKPQATGKLTNLDKVFLPAAVTTGAPAEDADNARGAAPTKLQSLGRLVSLADYEAETRMLPNVLKAAARWDAPDGVPAIVLTVLTASGSDADLTQVRDALRGYNRCRGPARHPLQVVKGLKQYVYVAANIGYNPAYLTDDLTRAIKAALGVVGAEADGIDGSGGLFGLNVRAFHENVHVSQVISAMQNVPGVVWVQLQAAQLIPLGTPPVTDPTLLPLPAFNLVPAAAIPCPTHFLLALHNKHCVLSFVSAQEQAVCPS